MKCEKTLFSLPVTKAVKCFGGKVPCVKLSCFPYETMFFRRGDMFWKSGGKSITMLKSLLQLMKDQGDWVQVIY